MWSKTLNDAKSVEYMNKNPQGILRINQERKDVPHSYKLPYHAYEWQNPLEIKKDNLSQRYC